MSRNPFLVRAEVESRTGVAYKHSRKQERKAAEDTGGRLIPASGSKFRKGDAEIPNLARIECKATQADSFRVTRGMFGKVDAAALLNNQMPYIEIEFLDERGKILETLCVTRRNDLVNLLRRATDAEITADPANPSSKRAPLKRSLRRP